MLRIQYAAITDPGCRRKHNEDAFLVNESSLLFGVADGVGGLSGGEIASRLALDEISFRYKEGNKKNLAEAIAAANTVVYRYGIDHGKTIATTLSLIALNRKQAFIANVGDSRVYLWRDGHLRQVTTDHTVKQDMLDKGLISKNSQAPSAIDHVITRAIGAEQRVKTDISIFKVQGNDVLLVCTDGITSMLTDDDIQASLRTMVNIEQASSDLLEKAKIAGGRDNITLILLAL